MITFKKIGWENTNASTYIIHFDYEDTTLYDWYINYKFDCFIKIFLKRSLWLKKWETSDIYKDRKTEYENILKPYFKKVQNILFDKIRFEYYSRETSWDYINKFNNEVEEIKKECLEKTWRNLLPYVFNDDDDYSFAFHDIFNDITEWKIWEWERKHVYIMPEWSCLASIQIIKKDWKYNLYYNFRSQHIYMMLIDLYQFYFALIKPILNNNMSIEFWEVFWYVSDLHYYQY